MSQSMVNDHGPNDGDASGNRNDAQWRRALELWLGWHVAHEQVTASMFQSGTDRKLIEQQLDEVDRIRLQAVEMSERLIQSEKAAA